METTNVTTTQPITNVPGDGQPPVDPGAQTYTKEAMERIVQGRLKRQRAQFADYDELKAQAARLAEYEDAQKTELERAQAAQAQAEEERDKARQVANDRLIRSAVVTEAAKLAFTDPGDAFAMVDLGDVTIGENGEVAGVLEAVKALSQAKPYLVGRRAAPATDAGAGGGERTTGTRLPRLTQEQVNYAKKMGITAEAYAKQVAAIAVQRAGGEVGDTQLDDLRAENRRLRAQLEQ